MSTSIEAGLTQPIQSKKLRAAREFKGTGAGVTFARVNTREGVHPYDEVEWELRTAAITNERGESVFEQEDVEVPSLWSQMATNVVVSKYFRGKIGTPQRERSVKQLISRVVDTITDWGVKDGLFTSAADSETFRAELTHLILHQRMAFNSPVWFNVGVEARPQASACFINSVQDTMESIMNLAKTECLLFKWGSGAGSNLSPIRSSREHLSGGGTASGPLSFMRGYDSFAGAIKSGGKTRRAAKMVMLDIAHPDIMDFVWCKAKEEQKAWALIDAGYDGGFNVPGGAYDSIYFQNANHSVRVSDAFMRAVEAGEPWQTRAVGDGRVMDTLDAREVLSDIAQATWLCGDPGMQYDTTINDWHTCPNTDRIYGSNPCVTGDTLVATSRGWQRIDQLLEAPCEIVGGDGELRAIAPAFKTGFKPVYRLRTAAGFELKLTADHRVWTKNRGDVPASELTLDDVLELATPRFGEQTLEADFAQYVGLMVGDGCIAGADEIAQLTLAPEELAVAQAAQRAVTRWQQEHAPDGRGARDVNVTQPQDTLRLATSSRCVVEGLQRWAVLDAGSKAKALTPEALTLDQASTAALLRGLFTADGTIANYGERSQYVSLESCSETLLSQVQLLLLGFGIKAKLYRNRRPLGQTMALLSDGKGGRRESPIEQVHSLRISRQGRVRFEELIGFVEGSAKNERLRELNAQVSAYADPHVDRVASLEFLGEEDVYDLTEPVTSHFVAAGLVVHNCSEYMFLNDSACNLASLNLLTFRTPDGEFDVEQFKHAVRLTITAQEIIVPNASYPTPQIEQNSHAFRPLGLGYTNLGALLMVRGLPYDSEQGRAVAGAITALMGGEAYRQSALIAESTGPFPGYPVNEEPMLRVIKKHRDAVEGLTSRWAAIGQDPIYSAAAESWDEAYSLGKQAGFRNSQVTVLAPTGTISFLMDCDTTGIEPDIALVKYKKLVGGGYFKIINRAVPEALDRLGYDLKTRKSIVDYVLERGTVEGAPGLNPEHLAVFDCAFKAPEGTRSIAPMGHVRMMAAAQPFISGALSKTVNVPHEASADDIAKVYIDAWKLGLKAIAIYRDGCKRTQPLSTKLDDGNSSPKVAQVVEVDDGVVPVAAESVAVAVASAVSAPMAKQRRRLADERPSITHKFSIAGHEGYITVGMYDDGQPGELFIVMSKEGSVVSGLMDSFATSISLGLQYGVPLEVLVEKFSFTRFEPSGITNNPRIRMAKSITDYIFRWLADKFLPEAQRSRYFPASAEADAHDPVAEAMAAIGSKGAASAQASPMTTASGVKALRDSGGFASAQPGSVVYESRGAQLFAGAQSDAPPCHVCGSMTVRSGACYLCSNCGATTGCG